MTQIATGAMLAAAAARVSGRLLLLALPFGIALILERPPVRTIDVQVSRYAFSPERIEVGVGEAVRLNVVSADVAHGFQVKELGVKTEVPAGGAPVTIELTPTHTGTFTIKCSEYCGRGHGRMTGVLVVTPRP